ncbi:MAG: lamin tail domain-containing protein [Myxococcota bacterium]
MIVRTLALLALGGCSGAVSPLAGTGPFDLDLDGWTALDGDCDDDDPAVNPDAIDWPGDGDDQDCDGTDGLALPIRALVAGDLVITEIQKRPIGVLATAGEWFEVRNDAGEPIDLFGLLIRGDEGDEVRVGQSVIVDDGDHAVLGAVADVAVNGEVPVDWAYGTELRIGNASGNLALVGTEVLSALSWDPRFPDLDGHAMQRTPDPVDPSLPGAWCSASTIYGIGGWGTPGAENDVCPDTMGAATLFEVLPGELVITEIMKDPLAVGGAFGEWIELRNASSRAIDLNGLELVDEVGDGIQLTDAYVLQPGSHAVLAASDDPSVNGGVVGAIAAWGAAFSLRNSEDTVILRYGTRVFDRVDYDNGVLFPDPSGASMQVSPTIDADANDDGAAWCVSTAAYGQGDLGTPGQPNPACPTP